MTRLAIFDCDGTLLDSQASICAAMEGCFAEAGLVPPARADTRRVVGLSLFEAMQRLHPGGDERAHLDLSDRYKLCFQRLRAAGGVEEPMFDGIRNALDAFAADGWTLGIATGKSDRGLALALAMHDLADRFATLQTANRHPSKPHPAMIDAAIAETGADRSAAVMIGDTSFDMAMARAAGVRAVGVAWGYHPIEELVAAGADVVVGDPDELADLLVGERA